jgi:hypothetical protein
MMATPGGGLAQPYAGLRIGRQRVPIDKKYPGQTVAQYAKEANVPLMMESSSREKLLQYQEENLHVRGSTAPFNERE